VSNDDSTPDAIKLSDENGLETWLDFKTGQLFIRPSHAPSGSSARPAPRRKVGRRRRAKDDGTLLSTVERMLVSRAFEYHRAYEKTLTLRVRGERAVYEVFFSVDETRRQAHCFANLPALAPDDRRMAVAEAIVRANYKMALGGFEMDFTDGEVRFHNAVAMEDSTLTEQMADQMLGVSIFTCDRFHDALVRVMVAGADPAEEIAAIDL
jgi:hypothetical protein